MEFHRSLLIGIWERSSASRKNKILWAILKLHLLPIPYLIMLLHGIWVVRMLSLTLNIEHGKEESAFASDMVPNHTGIYSKWVVEKPDYLFKLIILPTLPIIPWTKSLR